MGVVVDVYYGPPSKPRLEGQARVVEVVRYLGSGRYRVKCVFLGDRQEQVKVREIDIERRQMNK